MIELGLSLASSTFFSEFAKVVEITITKKIINYVMYVTVEIGDSASRGTVSLRLTVYRKE